MGSAQKPSLRPSSGSLPSLRSNAQMVATGRIDRPGTTIARSETHLVVLEQRLRVHQHQPVLTRKRKDWVERIRWSELVREVFSSDCWEVLEVVNSKPVSHTKRQSRSCRNYRNRNRTPPLEIADEIGHY